MYTREVIFGGVIVERRSVFALRSIPDIFKVFRISLYENFIFDLSPKKFKKCKMTHGSFKSKLSNFGGAGDPFFSEPLHCKFLVIFLIFDFSTRVCI